MHGQYGVRGREFAEILWWEQGWLFCPESLGTTTLTQISAARHRQNHYRFSMAEPDQKQWFFYLARCSDDSLYSGIAVDPVKRMEIHNAGKGARYTRSRLPVSMVYSEPLPDQSSALKREAAVRKWSRKKKEALIAGTLTDD